MAKSTAKIYPSFLRTRKPGAVRGRVPKGNRIFRRPPELKFQSHVPDILNFIHAFFDPAELGEALRQNISNSVQDPTLFFLRGLDHTINLTFANSEERDVENCAIDNLLVVINTDGLPDLGDEYPAARLNKRVNEELFTSVKARSALLVARKRSRTKELINILEKIIPKFASNAKSVNGKVKEMQVNTFNGDDSVNPFFFQTVTVANAVPAQYKWHEPREFDPFHCLVASLHMAYRNLGKNNQAAALLDKYPEVSPESIRYYESAYGKIDTNMQV